MQGWSKQRQGRIEHNASLLCIKSLFKAYFVDLPRYARYASTNATRARPPPMDNRTRLLPAVKRVATIQPAPTRAKITAKTNSAFIIVSLNTFYLYNTIGAKRSAGSSNLTDGQKKRDCLITQVRQSLFLYTKSEDLGSLCHYRYKLWVKV